MLTKLQDGTLMRIRPIRSVDKAALQDGMRHLSPETIHNRFLAAKPRLSSSELRYLTEVDGWNHVALVASPLDDPERIIGAARFVRDTEDPGTAEFAIVVADAYQGRGLGSALAEALVERARARRIKRFTATTLESNEPVQRLIARISRGLEHVAHEGVTRTVSVELAA